MKRHTPKETGRISGEEHEDSSMDNELHKLFLKEVGDIYNAENQLIKALQKMAKNSECAELREAFEEHLEETKNHATRLEEVVKSVGDSMKKKTCFAMQGIIKEAEELLEEEKDSSALDAALIGAAQKVEHYEIASYGTLAAWARQMNHEEAAELLEETLEEEKAADKKLTSVGESIANEKAQSA